MLFVFGFLTVVLSVIVGYTMHAGDLSLLWQPNEVLIIAGSAIGATMIGAPWHALVHAVKSCANLLKARPYTKDDYLELLLLNFNSFKLMKTKGMLAIESHIETPETSDLFAKAPSINTNPLVSNFFRDNLRLVTMGVANPHQLEDIIDKELEERSEYGNDPYHIFSRLADALPALGIVGAVLGVIITMRSIMEPPEILGSLIAAALVGTFTGVLLSYGFCAPISSYLKTYAEHEMKYLECIKIGLVSYLNNHPPIIIVEFMRKSVPSDVRPEFYELDDFINDNMTHIN